MADSPKPLLTAEYRRKVHSALMKRHGRHLNPGETFADYRVELMPEAWTFTVTFQNADKSVHLPVETALVESENPKLKPAEALDILIDFVDYYFGEYFKGGRDVTLPLDWQAFTFGEFTVRARGWQKNLKLEEAADRLLAGEPLDDIL